MLTPNPTDVAGAQDARAAGLRRMRFIATLLLAMMTAVFIAASFAQQRWPWLAYVRAFAEAGMVGACADWFAVVALFRHPLGIPIPHTAIVPQNKARIARAMGRFITGNFLTPHVLTQRLAEVDIAQWLADALRNPDTTRRLARSIAAGVPELWRALPRSEIADALGRSLWRAMEAAPAAPVLANLLAIAWGQGETRKVIEVVLDFVEAELVRNKDLIRRKVEERSSPWIPRFVDAFVADKIVSGVTGVLGEMRNPSHPWRLELKSAVESLIERLSGDEALRARLEAAKAELIASPLLREQLQVLWDEIEMRLPSDMSVYSGRIEAAVDSLLVTAGCRLHENAALRTRINRWTRYLVRRVVSPRRAAVGAFVTRIVDNWDATTLVNRMELQVGRDLQYIRINGTLVGGLVGLTIYALSQWLLPG